MIFGLDRVVRLNGNFSAVTRDDNGALTGMSHPESYTLYSRINVYAIQFLRSAGSRIPENIRRYYLQLPAISPRVSDLAQTIAGKQATAYDRVVAVKKYLEANYAYTTTDLPRSSDDPISAFLFEKKAGHCEYFATSMVLLVRSLGIPARLVNGFLEGEYNEIGNFYAIRQSDAHSWVEVYFDGAWVRFDPSPRQVAARAGSGSSFFAYFNVKKIFDSISFFWDRYILIFSGQDQLDAISTAQEKYHELKETVRSKSNKTSRYFDGPFFDFIQKRRIAVTLLTAAALALLLALRHYLHWKKQRSISRTPILFYQEMLNTLGRFGFIRSPEKTPAEFVRSIAGQLPQEYEQDLMQITQLFYRSRFGNHDLSSSEQRTVRASLQHLQQLR